MPFGRKARPCRVYEFGVRKGPTAGRDLALDQMFGRVRLWNALVEMDQRFEAEQEHILTEESGGTWPVPEATPAADKKRARRALFALDAVKTRLKDLDERRKTAAKAAGHEVGLYWVNTDEVLAAYDLARRQPGTLRFHSAAKEDGHISVRWQNGVTVSALFAGRDTCARIEPVSADAHWSPVRGMRRQASHTIMRVRVGSDEKHKPIWLELPISLHRPMPMDGLVRRVSVLRERLGVHERWRVILTVEEAPRARPLQQRGIIGIDVGWRKRPDGRLRVAFWHDDQGRSGEIALPADWIGQMQKVDDLRSIRDQHVNTLRPFLAAWVKANADRLPEWFKEEAPHLALWKRNARFLKLERQWREQRFPEDTAGYEALVAWRKRELHLLAYEVHLRDQLIKSRREQFRRFAAHVAQTYATVRLEVFNLEGMADRRREAANLVDPVRHQRVLANVSGFRLVLDNACRREGVEVEVLPAQHTTSRCHHCLTIETFDKATELVHTCSQCGSVWDIDDNAARNLLKRQVALAA